jgi:NAD(P)-dependent dehydrogenase (short-subunit alcohol dehydrogenase family)
MKVNELMSLKGKVAIVTGGGRGIGLFIAQGLAEAGADLVIASRKVQKCEEACSKLIALGVKAIPVKCDMASDDEIKNLVDVTMKEFGRIDILVNNAGINLGLAYPGVPPGQVGQDLCSQRTRRMGPLPDGGQHNEGAGWRQDDQHLVNIRLPRVH